MSGIGNVESIKVLPLISGDVNITFIGFKKQYLVP